MMKVQTMRTVLTAPEFSWRQLAFVSVAILTLSACTSAGETKVASLAPVTQYGATAGSGSGGVHTVLSGDTISAIARMYKLDPQTIIALNDISDWSTLKPGQRLKLPAPDSYVVRAGDSVPLLSRLFSIPENNLRAMNNLNANAALTPGQIIKLPSGLPQNTMMASALPAPVTIIPMMAAPVSPPTTFASNTAPVQTIEGVLGTLTIPRKPETTYATGTLGTLPVASNETPMPTQTVAAVPTPMIKPVIETGNTNEEVMAVLSPNTPIEPRMGSRFLRPVNGEVLSKYGAKTGGLYNEGINIAAARGTAVRAADNGRVVYVGNAVEGYGNMVLIKHADGYITAYAHMDKSLISAGQDVKRGQPIGTVGATGHVDRAQLHFEIRKGRESIDPVAML